MKDKIIKRALLGFLIGMVVGNLISIFMAYLSSSDSLCTPQMIERFGSETNAIFMQTLCSGIHGAISMAGVSFYDIEEWGLLKASITHCLLIEISFICTALFMQWIEFDLLQIGISVSVIAFFYFIIWLIINFSYKNEVSDLNELLKRNKDDQDKV